MRPGQGTTLRLGTTETRSNGHVMYGISRDAQVLSLILYSDWLMGSSIIPPLTVKDPRHSSMGGGPEFRGAVDSNPPQNTRVGCGIDLLNSRIGLVMEITFENPGWVVKMRGKTFEFESGWAK